MEFRTAVFIIGQRKGFLIIQEIVFEIRVSFDLWKIDILDNYIKVR